MEINTISMYARRVWDEKFTYSASTYEGDCGCPILIRDGKVVGMHVSFLMLGKYIFY